MKIKLKVIQDVQYLTEDKKIIVLKSGSIIEEYVYKFKNDIINIDRDIIHNNVEFFQPVDWRSELNACLKQNKIPQPAIIVKKIAPFIEEMFIVSNNTNNNNNTSSDNISKLELELESKLRKFELREEQLQLEIRELQKKEKEFIIKEKELRKFESEINNRESNIDQLILDSNSNLDIKQQEMNDKVENKLLELKEREKEIELKIINIEKREKDIENMSNNTSDYISKKNVINIVDEYKYFGRLSLEPWGANIIDEIIDKVKN